MRPPSFRLDNDGLRLPRESAGNSHDHDVRRVPYTSVLRTPHLFLSKFRPETRKVSPSIKPGGWVLAQGVIVTSSCLTILGSLALLESQREN